MESATHRRSLHCQPTSKRRHPDEESANREAERLCRTDGASMRGYYCQHCQGYHVGHTPIALTLIGLGTRGDRCSTSSTTTESQSRPTMP